jgi:Xaa-Pro aminopeptidase
MPTLTTSSLPELQKAIAEAGLDGWLLFDFRGLNPIAAGLLGIEGMVTRRYFAFIPREGVPVAITHGIEQGPWAAWPKGWKKEVYVSWRTLEGTLGKLLKGKRIAMEYSPGDAVMYLDRIPAGVIEMIRAAGAEVVSSGELVTRFYAVWTPAQLEAHQRAAEVIAGVARDAMRLAGDRARSGASMHEYDLMQWIRGRFERAGLFTDHGPNVSVGANAANPHYEPTSNGSGRISDGDVVLIDLWATEPNGIYADQTWMGSVGAPSSEVVRVWETVRDARDTAIALVRERAQSGSPLRGAEVDAKTRQVITSRGYGDYFIHRTGHSIDAHDLHGSGPHLDDFETREERRLIPGIGFSIEPGVYLPGRFGVRSEVNVFLEKGRAIVTPTDYQRDLWVV